jgi:hypothetical protein
MMANQPTSQIWRKKNTSFSFYIRMQDLKKVNEIGILNYELGFWKLSVSWSIL